MKNVPKGIPSFAFISCYVLCIIALTSTLLLSTTTAAQNLGLGTMPPTEVTFIRDIKYGPYPAETLDICRPAGAAGLHPGIIMIHGGAWVRGDRRGLLDKWCKQFAQLGFVVANIDYRLANEEGPTPNWPAFQIGDVQLAIRWMRMHANELGLDPNRIGAYGSSAGGYLAVYAATLQTIHPSDVASIAPNIPVTLSCVADSFGPVDLVNPHYLVKVFNKLIGGPYNQYPDIYKEDSPLYHITPHTPPAFVIHGTQDTLVPIAQSEELVATLKRNGVQVQFITYEGDHAYKGLSPDQMNGIFQHIAQFFKNQMGN